MSLGPIFGAIDVALVPPHAQAQSIPPGWTPPSIEIDPGAYADIDPAWLAGPPPYVPADGAWGTLPAFPTEPVPTPTRPPDASKAEQPIPVEPDEGIGDTPSARGVEALTLGDHMWQGANGWLLPGLVGGGFGGMLAASAAPAGTRSLVFGAKLVGGVVSGVATGAGAGLLVAATSPKDGDSLAARYAIASASLGAAGGALFPGGTSRAVGAALGALSSGLVGGFIGHGIQQRAERS